MFNAITFLSSRTGILLVSLLLLSLVFSWGMMQKVQKVELEKRIAQDEAAYQQRVAVALERQRDAIDQATLAERQRLKDIESKWKTLKASLNNEKDYKSAASASVIHALNRLSEPSGDGAKILSPTAGIPVNQ